MPDVHATLAPSGAERWIACPPSLMLERKFPAKETQYTQEGTLAHSLAETILKHDSGEISDSVYRDRLSRIRADPMYSQAMQDYIEDYVAQVSEFVAELRAAHGPDVLTLFEQRVTFQPYVPQSFGTSDVVLLADRECHIIDLKYGQGVRVDAVNNPQLRLYALGAVLLYDCLYDIDRVRMTIIQPRLGHISTDETTADGLRDWAQSVVRPAAEQALKGEGQFQAGSHCHFCRALPMCKTHHAYEMALVRHDFAEPGLLSDQELSEILDKGSGFVHWINKVQDYALTRAVSQQQPIPGWKLVRSRGNRKIMDEDAAVQALHQAGYTDSDIYEPRKLRGVTAMEKLLGPKAFAQVLGGCVEKPEGKPALVRDSDARREIDLREEVKRKLMGDD